MANFVRHYAVFKPAFDSRTSDKWARCTNKRNAIRHAKLWKGYAIAVSYGSDMAWDAPTFKAVGDVIADYRESV